MQLAEQVRQPKGTFFQKVMAGETVDLPYYFGENLGKTFKARAYYDSMLEELPKVLVGVEIIETLNGKEKTKILSMSEPQIENYLSSFEEEPKIEDYL